MATTTATNALSSMASRTVSAAAATSSHKVSPQGGIIEGANPTVYNPKDPITMFIIQAGIIIIFCRLLHYPLQKLRQPRVIAEVIGGILLGPSVMGRIPGFTETIFPTASMPNLTLVANLGLVLFLFLVGLEVDLRFLVGNWRVALSVGLAGMALPFGLGAAISYGLYNEFRNEPGTVAVNFGIYLLFIGVAMAITAFPVLCRILTELKLLSTPVGVIVLSAGVGNDVVGWVLLALCVALVNTGTGLTALWVLLTCIGYALFLAFAVRPAFMWILRKSRALQDGPSQGVIVLTLILALSSAFFTGIIGVHPIFGAFMVGLICPHEGGFAIKVTEKIEDLVSALFLPLYFALSGLNTNLGLLDSGMVWAYVVGVIAVAFCAKFVGASIAARLNGLVWRECFTIGALMSCKGLVELIVLNIGLQAKILSQRTFTIFVVMALVTTFATTPLTSFLYPPWYQRKLEQWKRGEIDWDTGAPIGDDGSGMDSLAYEKLESAKMHKLLVYLRLDSMSAILPFVSLFAGNPPQAAPKVHPSKATGGTDLTLPAEQPKRPIEAHGVRILELTERNSSVMQVSELDEYGLHDPVVNTFRTFGFLHNVSVSGEVAVVPSPAFAEALVSKAAEGSSDLLIIPWSETGNMSELATPDNSSTADKLSSGPYNDFVSTALSTVPCTTAIFVNRDFGGSSMAKERPALYRTLSHHSLRSNSNRDCPTLPSTDRSHHVFFAFIGGPDDRAALRLVLHMAEKPEVTATIVHIESHVDSSSGAEPAVDPASPGKQATATSTSVATAATTSASDAAFFASLRTSLPAGLAARVFFDYVFLESADDVGAVVLERARRELGQAPRNAGDLMVVGRRRGDGAEGEAGRCLGALAEAVVKSGVRTSVVVVQAGGKGE
ncbi:hypothetical protein K490DRAFT_64333 [Saccharata proteae CBS 121410]|uniref:Cation/H+ exchanger transmembrane domain-containing protein n=1 Tax=Saccharata proteae CBS 121410 TaxID=1314787 RepID=A0A6A5YBN6_9PEZI|nr:hypothetical protein K490DRAFT_64333 [Saccharata proteae CBS 121410]